MSLMNSTGRWFSTSKKSGDLRWSRLSRSWSSLRVLNGLIDEALKDLTGEERLAFVERLFVRVPTESQERLIRTLVGDLAAESGQPAPGPDVEHRSRPLFIQDGRQDLPPRDIGPWRTCCRMMAEVDRASRLDALDADRPARVFGALGDETRIRIIKLLSQGKERVEKRPKHVLLHRNLGGLTLAQAGTG